MWFYLLLILLNQIEGDAKCNITSRCTRQRTRCPFVCMLAGSHFRTQIASTCTASERGVRQRIVLDQNLVSIKLIKRLLSIIFVLGLVGCGPGLQDGSTKITGDVYLNSRHVLGDSLVLRISKGHSRELVDEHVIALQVIGSSLGVARYPVNHRDPDYETTQDCEFYLIDIEEIKAESSMTHKEFYQLVDRRNLEINLIPNTLKYGHLCKEISR